jgi:hypothetical protein
VAEQPVKTRVQGLYCIYRFSRSRPRIDGKWAKGGLKTCQWSTAHLAPIYHISVQPLTTLTSYKFNDMGLASGEMSEVVASNLP